MCQSHRPAGETPRSQLDQELVLRQLYEQQPEEVLQGDKGRGAGEDAGGDHSGRLQQDLEEAHGPGRV